MTAEGTVGAPTCCNENSKTLNCKLNRLKVGIMTLNCRSSTRAYLIARMLHSRQIPEGRKYYVKKLQNLCEQFENSSCTFLELVRRILSICNNILITIQQQTLVRWFMI
jgi:hypothetical protein